MSFSSNNLIEFNSDRPLVVWILKSTFGKMLTDVIKIGRLKYLNQMDTEDDGIQIQFL